MSAAAQHPIFAGLSPRADAMGAREHRRERLAGLTGRVLAPGADTGLNFRDGVARPR